MSHLLFILFAVHSLMGFSYLPIRSQNNQVGSFNIHISQKGQVIEAIDNCVSLERYPFDIVLEFSKPMGVLVNASFDRKTFMLAKQNVHLDSLPGFFGTGMADVSFNLDSSISINYEAPNYWYYTSKDEHRFNEIEFIEDRFFCTRTIKYLSRVEYDSLTHEQINSDLPEYISDAPLDTLYLVFVSYERRTALSKRVEVQREYLKLIWKE